MRKIHIVVAFLLITGVSLALEFNGNTVYIDDPMFYFSVNPHTIRSSGYVTYELESKNYSGNINLIWMIDKNNLKPSRTELYFPIIVNTERYYVLANVTKSENTDLDCQVGYDYSKFKKLIITQVANEIICYDSVEITGKNRDIYNFIHNEQSVKEWIELPKIDKILNVVNPTKYDNLFYSKNIPIQKNVRYKLRFWFDVPIGLKGLTGKYDIGFYPSSYDKNLSNAVLNNNFYSLDPYYNTSMPFWKLITINNSMVSGNLTNFSVALLLNSSNLDFTKIDANCGDFRFAFENGTELKYEIENCNTSTGFAQVWVNYPFLNTSGNNSFYMAYGISGLNTTADRKNVWDKNYKMVYHAADWGSNLIDSVENYNMAKTSITTVNASKIGLGVNCTTGSWAKTSAMSYGNTTGITIEAWINPYTTQNNYNSFVSHAMAGVSEHITLMTGTDTSNNNWTSYLYGGTPPSGTYHYDGLVAQNVWSYFVFVWNTTHFSYYVNGQQYLGWTAKRLYNPDVASVLCRWYSNFDDYYSLARLDEIRISFTNRSIAQINTTYNNIEYPDQFYSFGLEETVVSVPPEMGNIIIVDKNLEWVMLNWTNPDTVFTSLEILLKNSSKSLHSANLSKDYISYNYTMLHDCTFYNFSVRAYNNLFVSSWSAIVFTTDCISEDIIFYDTTKESTLLSNHDYCYDNNTQLKNLTYENCVIISSVQTCYTSNKVQYISCETGCDSNTGKCRPDALIGLIVIIVIVIGVIYLLYRFSRG